MLLLFLFDTSIESEKQTDREERSGFSYSTPAERVRNGQTEKSPLAFLIRYQQRECEADREKSSGFSYKIPAERVRNGQTEKSALAFLIRYQQRE